MARKNNQSAGNVINYLKLKNILRLTVEDISQFKELKELHSSPSFI